MGNIAIVLVSLLLIIANFNGTSAQQLRTLFEYPSGTLSINDLEGQEAELLPNVQKSSEPQKGNQLESLRRNIPGEPEIDYPIFRTPPETAFSCQSRATGYYADVEARCQVFRVCTNTDLSGLGFAFLCPNGTLFNQQVFVCDWYQHVDCASSENFYGKNVELNMNITSMSDMMAVVDEMMNFPFKSNATRPTIFPNFPSTFPQTTQPTTTRFNPQTTRKPVQLPSTSLRTPTTNQFAPVATNANTRFGTPAPSKQPNIGVGQQTITKEGDFNRNTKTQTNGIQTDKQTTFSNQPIFISSLGELSTDVGNKFDINKSKIVKPDTNNPITPPPTASSTQTAGDQLRQSLSQSFQNRQNNFNAADAGEVNLLQSLQEVLRAHPDAITGEADLIEFIQQLLQRNPDLTPDQLNAILSKESDAILTILSDSIERNRISPTKKMGKNELLDSIQTILNKYKSKPTSNSAFGTQTNQIPVFSGEADLLSQTIQRIVQQSPIPIFSGEADLVQFIERLVQQNSDFSRQELGTILSGEADSILSILYEKKQQNDNNASAVFSGEADLLEAIQLVLQKYRTNRQQLPSQTGSFVPNQRGPSRGSITDKNKPAQTTQSSLKPAVATTTPSPPKFVSQQSGLRDSSKSTLFNSNINKNSIDANNLKPVSGDTQNAKKNLVIFTESGDEDLIEILDQILERTPNQREPIFTDAADRLQFIKDIKKQNSDLPIEQLSGIIAGEADAILQILNEKAQQNTVNGLPQLSGKKDLLNAIQVVVQKYREDSQKVPPLPEPIFSGEMDLLETLHRILDQISIPVLSGEADLLQFIRRIEQRNPDYTPAQLNAIISGEADSILSIFNQRQAQKSSSELVFSGEADLLDAIQQVIDKSKGNKSGASAQPVPVASGSSDPLVQTIERIRQETGIPIFSGEADLVQFIERIVQQNPEFTRDQLSAILSGEADLIVQFLKQKAQRSNGFAVSFGEADLLEAIQIALDKYKNKAPIPSTALAAGEGDLLQTLRQIKQQSSVPLFAGEADLLRFSQRLQEQNPKLTPSQLNNIIMREINAILKYVSDKQEKDPFENFAVYSGEEDLLVAVQYYVEQYANPETGAIVPPPIAQSVPVRSGSSDLVQALQRIQQQTSIPIFSGEADLVSFIELIKQRNPDFTSDQLTAIISGEADSIQQILNGKIQNAQKSGIPISGEADLLEAIQLVLQKYRSRGVPSPSLTQFSPAQAPQTIPSTPSKTIAVQSGDANLLQTIQRIQQQSAIPVFSGEADLVTFIELIKQRNPDLATEQLNAIISGEANSILQILSDKSHRNQNNGVPVLSGEADLLEAIELILQKYRSHTQSSIPSTPQTIPARSQTLAAQPQTIAVQSGEANLLQSLKLLQQQSSIPIFSGEADLVSFIELIKQRNPDFTQTELSTIISGEANSILQIFNEKRQNAFQSDRVISGEADLLEAIFQVLQKYRKPYPPSGVPSGSSIPTSNGGRTSLHGQVTAVSSGQTNAVYQYTNGSPEAANANGKGSYSVEQNKQSQFSNQRSQSTKSQVTKNVYRGEDNIYTKTAISHQTRSQSTATNSEKIHYKITEIIPYQQTFPAQNVVPIPTSTSANTYIPPYPPTQAPFTYTQVPASKQVFTYPSETEARRRQSSASVNIATDSIKYQQAYNKQIEQQTPDQNAYVYEEIAIENRPPVNPNVPHAPPPPPLQTIYPESIQNNVRSRVVNRPIPIRQYNSSPIPSSLPSIVHAPSNTVATVQNAPAAASTSAYTTSYASYSTPVITSTYSNREIYSQANRDAREKVIVKVVKAPGWYLNDENERRSYFDAVAHGLLSGNGLVYVNNVQKENSQLAQNPPIGSVQASAPSPSPPVAVAHSTAYLPRNYAPSPQLQSQSVYGTGIVQPLNSLNYCPCARTYSQPLQLSRHAQLQQPQFHTQSSRLPYKKRSATEGNLYSGRSSYNVGQQSVGRLAGDNLNYQYSLASLRRTSQRRLPTYSQRRQ